MVSHFTKFGKFKGSYLLSPAQGKGGARATIQNVSAPPSAEQIKLSREGGSAGGFKGGMPSRNLGGIGINSIYNIATKVHLFNISCSDNFN